MGLKDTKQSTVVEAFPTSRYESVLMQDWCAEKIGVFGVHWEFATSTTTTSTDDNGCERIDFKRLFYFLNEKDAVWFTLVWL